MQNEKQTQFQLVKKHINAAIKACDDTYILGELEVIIKYIESHQVVKVKKVATTKTKGAPKKRLPKVWTYHTDNWMPKDLAKELKQHKDECIGGDMFIPSDYEKTGYGTIYFVSPDKKELLPIVSYDQGNALPAWLLELGAINGHGIDDILGVYTKVRGIMKQLHFYILPQKDQVEHFQIWDYVYPIKVHWFKTNKTEVISDEYTLNEMFGENYGPKAADVFLSFLNPGKKTHGLVTSPSVKKTVKVYKAPKSSTLLKSSPSESTKCIAQTTKKYTTRPSPPFPASDCPGLSKTGNDGQVYTSVANVKGIYSWKLAR